MNIQYCSIDEYSTRNVRGLKSKNILAMISEEEYSTQPPHVTYREAYPIVNR